MHLSISSSEDVKAHPSGLSVLAFMLVTTLLVIATATEVLVRRQVQPQDHRFAHLELLANTDHVDAAFGDSHVARGFDASGGFVNLAYPSENIEDMIRKVDHFYENRAAGLVILQADPHLFASYRLAATPAELTLGSPVLHFATEQHRPQLLAYWRAFFSNNGRLESSVVRTPMGALLSSGDLSKDPERKQLRDARSRLGLHTIAPARFFKSAQERYSLLLNKLIAKGADVCLVTYPVSPAYNGAQNDETWRQVSAGHAQAMTFFAEEAARVQATHWDARSHVTDTRLFRDVDHLNAAGARTFASELTKACFD